MIVFRCKSMWTQQRCNLSWFDSPETQHCSRFLTKTSKQLCNSAESNQLAFLGYMDFNLNNPNGLFLFFFFMIVGLFDLLSVRIWKSLHRKIPERDITLIRDRLYICIFLHESSPTPTLGPRATLGHHSDPRPVCLFMNHHQLLLWDFRVERSTSTLSVLLIKDSLSLIGTPATLL